MIGNVDRLRKIFTIHQNQMQNIQLALNSQSKCKPNTQPDIRIVDTIKPNRLNDLAT